MDINPDNLNNKERYKLLIGSVIPRPIAFVSTISKEGVRNLAPYSFYTIACFNPMIIAFFPIRYKKGSEKKDTCTNIMETGEFVVNVATEDILQELNTTSGLYDAEVDEFSKSGLSPVESSTVKAPGVLESPIRMECRLYKTLSIGEDEGGSDAIFGRVVHLYADDRLIDNYRIDEKLLKPVSRLAGMSYSTLGKVIDIPRPKL